MYASSPFRLATLAMVLSFLGASSASAGGHGGAVFRPGFHPGMGGYRGGGAWRGVPPLAGVIHERPGMRPTYFAYGHTRTGFAGYGHVDTASRAGRPAYAARFGYAYGFRGAPRRYAGRYGEARRFRFARYTGGFGGGYGGEIGGYDGAGVSGGQGLASSGTYGGQGTYGNPGTYGNAGSYGGQGTYGRPGTYGGGVDDGSAGGEGFTYRSETPLAARFAEPPLAPSPYAPARYGDRYAYEAADDVEPGPRASGCGCGDGQHGAPQLYRYGVGTAY